ncbi:hypothetical protein [Methylococcus sp. EFPC2]|uniref:DUF58 domain-containing protein n=1 Tax=Methylococcus sp. EFPC2 TaxID=2812648 RepID=UPI001F079D5F|nr:hypothetical protein [Methylococcus sp. EFPC2]
MPEIDYRLKDRARGLRAGAHRGAHSGSGWIFQDWAPFLAHPDGRRLDLRRSLVDPLETCWVRRYRQPTRIPVWVVADLSGSMGYRGNIRKLGFLADLVESLAYSSYRLGDRFGFVGCAERPLSALHVPAHRGLAAALTLAARLRDWVPSGSHARGLAECAPYLSQHRGLVFLISDFHLPVGTIRLVFERLHHHDLVPVVLWDEAEQGRQSSGTGPRRVVDLEGGGERVLWLRGELRRRLESAFEDRRQRLQALARARGCQPLFVEGAFSADAFNRYFAWRS